MGNICLRAEPVAPAGRPAPATPALVDASVQTEEPKGEAAVQTSGCRQCLAPTPGAGTGSSPGCRCAQLEELLGQVAELQEEVKRLQVIREAERELATWYQPESALEPQQPVNQPETPPVKQEHTSVDGYTEPHVQPVKSSSRQSIPRCRNSITSTNEEHPHIGNYRLLKILGKGSFGKVKLARHVLTGREVAVKIIDKTQLNPTRLQKLSREVRIMKKLNHPNIVKLFEVIETEKTLYLVMEYASEGPLFDYLAAHGRLKEKEARAKFRQIVSAVQYCHQKCVVHRDLKPENLLLDAGMNIKIADFGLSEEFTVGNKLDAFCGSPPYVAPEIFKRKKYDGPKVDAWSLGVILYELVSGSLPFGSESLQEVRERVLSGKYHIPFFMSPDCEKLLKKLLVLNPIQRGSLEQIMKDRWMNIGHEEELKPEPEPDLNDTRRIDIMVTMGFSREEIHESLVNQKYDEVMATYLLLGRKPPEFEGGKSLSSSNLGQRSRPSSDLGNGSVWSPAHLKVQRSISTNQKQRRFSDHGEDDIPTIGPSIPPAASHTKRAQAKSVESEQKEDWDKDVSRKLSSTTVGSKGEMAASPLVGPERKESTTVPRNNVFSGSGMTRRNTDVCERSSHRCSAMQNGKDNSSATQRVPAASPSAHSIGTATPDGTRFPRGSSSQSTSRGEQLRERRDATYNGPPASPSRETGAFARARRGTSTGIISKITSKFAHRSVSGDAKDREKDSKDSKPRSLRFMWRMKTTSSMDPDDMMREIIKC